MGQGTLVGGGKNTIVSIPASAGGCADPIGDTGSWWILAKHDARARGTANFTGRVAVCESHAVCCELVDIGCFVERASFDADVSLAEIIDEEKDDIHWLGLCDGVRTQNGESQSERYHREGGEFFHL